MSRLTNTLAALALGVASSNASAVIIMSHDEWQLSTTGFANASPGAAQTFAQNIASYFTGGGTGSFYAYSTNFGLANASLSNAMTSAGHSWGSGTGISFDLPTLPLTNFWKKIWTL